MLAAGDAASARHHRQEMVEVSTAADATSAAGEPSALRRNLVEEQVLEHAAALFAEKGFGGTSLEDIAGRVGMKRPSLYHYFRSKDDILANIVGNMTDRGPHLVTSAATREDWDPPAKLHAMAHALCTEVASRPNAFRLVLVSEADLAPELAERVDAGKRTVTHTIADVIAAGIRSGDFRAVDPRLAALGVLGMCNWTAWWFAPGPDNPVEPVADAVARQAVRSVVADADQPRHDGDPRVVLDALRAGLETLDTLLDRDDRA